MSESKTYHGMNEIGTYHGHQLFLGQLPQQDPRMYVEAGIRAIVSILDDPRELPNRIRTTIPMHIFLALPDRADVPYPCETAAKSIDAALAYGPTLVHCAAGVSRSASAVIAYLMMFQGMDYVTAYQYVKSKRPVIHPNPGFSHCLQLFEQLLQNGKSHAPAPSPPQLPPPGLEPDSVDVGPYTADEISDAARRAWFEYNRFNLCSSRPAHRTVVGGSFKRRHRQHRRHTDDLF